jgi:hypothetical protein
MFALPMVAWAEWSESAILRRHSERMRLVKAICVIRQGKPDFGACRKEFFCGADYSPL